MRFNSPEHIINWQMSRAYPAIHDNIFAVVQNYCKGQSVLDLCCSYGLLGQRIKSRMDINVIGVDSDNKAVCLAKEAGIEIDIEHLKIEEKTLANLCNLLYNNKIDTIVARRCIPELFGDNIVLGEQFAKMAYKAGVNEIFIEGRMLTKQAKNELATLDSEIWLFDKFYTISKKIKNVAYLTKRAK